MPVKPAAMASRYTSAAKSVTVPNIRRKPSKKRPNAATDSANAAFFDQISSSVIRTPPSKVEHLIAANTEAGLFKTNLEIATKIRQDPLRSRFLKGRLYMALLALLAAEGSRNCASLALQLYREMADADCTSAELVAATRLLYACFENCDDFTLLIGLKSVFLSIISVADLNFNAEVGYYACHMHVLLNTGQITLATAHFYQCLEHVDRSTLFCDWPLHKHLKSLVSSQDCEAICGVISETFEANYDRLILPALWSEILGLALWRNDLALVKLVYENVIMHGVAIQDIDDVLLDPHMTLDNAFLRSLSSDTLAQILHTFASHGDVPLSLGLIEWHFVRMPMKGEAALTKDLCLLVIRAYCFHHPDAGEIATQHESDASVKTVLDVVDAFVAKKRHIFTYSDIAEAFLHKLSTYHVFDVNVSYSRAKEISAPLAAPSYGTPEEEIPEKETILEKKSNRNAHESALGSVLKNTEILVNFVAEHWLYILKRNYSKDTACIFVDGLLWHLATHQNTTGVILALQLLSQITDDFSKTWLTSSLYDIIIRSVSESPAAMATGLTLYEHMKQTQLSVSEQNYKYFVYSSLRGDAYNSLLEYYVHEYLALRPDIVSPRLIERIRAFKRLNEEGRVLLRCLENFRPQDFDHLDNIWDSYGFNRVCPGHISPCDEYARYSNIDQRDQEILKLILN